MKMKKMSFLLALCLLLFSVTAGATDYKAWVPLLPDTLAGLTRSGKPDGINMEMSGQKWSSLHQRYSTDKGEKAIELTIVGGEAAPQLAQFQMMSSMKMETEDQIVKTVKVSGYKGLLNIEKKGRGTILMISLSDEMMVVIAAEAIKSEAEALKLAEHLPLAKFAAQAK
jgi:hypothetical protein